MAKPWTKDEVELLKQNYRKMDLDALAELLGRNKNAIIQYAYRHGITTGRYLTEQQKRYINKHVGYVSYQDMAKRLHVTTRRIKTHCSRNGTICSMCETRITLAEACNLVGRDKESLKNAWVRRGLEIYKVGRHSMIPIDNLLDVMQKHPEIWDATRCEKWYFEQYPWFNQKREQDMQKMIDKRWGAFVRKEVV